MNQMKKHIAAALLLALFVSPPGALLAQQEAAQPSQAVISETPGDADPYLKPGMIIVAEQGGRTIGVLVNEKGAATFPGASLMVGGLRLSAVQAILQKDFRQTYDRFTARPAANWVNVIGAVTVQGKVAPGTLSDIITASGGLTGETNNRLVIVNLYKDPKDPDRVRSYNFNTLARGAEDPWVPAGSVVYAERSGSAQLQRSSGGFLAVLGPLANVGLLVTQTIFLIGR